MELCCLGMILCFLRSPSAVAGKFQGPQGGTGTIQRSDCFTMHDAEITVPPVGHPEEI